MMTEWDYFTDYCSENNLNAEVEDFDAWRDEQRDRAEDAAVERYLDWLNER